MKKLILSLIITAIGFMIPSTLWAQSPQEFNYQAVLRDNGNLIAEESVDVRFSLRQASPNGTVVYKEAHNTTTDQFGHLNLSVGAGTALTGVFANIDWGSGAKYLQVEVNYGSGYEDMGAQQLLSVPYALHAGNSSSGSNPTGAAGGDLTGSYPNPAIANAAVTGEKIDQMGATDGQVLKWDGTIWEPADDETGTGGSTGDDWGSQVTEITDRLTGDGTSGNPLDIAQQGANDGQVLKWNGTTWEPANDETGTGGGSGDDWGAQVTETDATLTGDGTAGNELGIADNGVTADKLTSGAVTSEKIDEMGATNGQVLKFDGTNWLPGNDNEGPAGTTYTAGNGIDISGTNEITAYLGTDIETDELQDAAVTTPKIADNAITFDKVNDGAITSPKIDAMGATDGQFLKFDGTNWVPDDVTSGTGDDWGSQVAETDASLTGDGTSGNELGLAQNGATDDQILIWDDANSSWTPTDQTTSGDGFFEADTDQIIYANTDDFGKDFLLNTDEIDYTNTSGDPEFKMMFLPSKLGAFRAGRIVNSNWDLDDIGEVSFAFGNNSTASGFISTAIGEATIASGDHSIAMGLKTEASGNNSTAIGWETQAIDIADTAMGYKTIASGSYSTAMGYKSEATGEASFATGWEAKATGEMATSMGWGNQVSGYTAIAMGSINHSSGDGSVALGRENVASGQFTLATGNNNVASGPSATAMGRGTIASGGISTAMGMETEASASYSTSMGLKTTASGWASTAMGDNAKAKASNSTVIGRNITLSTTAKGSMFLGDAYRSGNDRMGKTGANRFYAVFHNGYVLHTDGNASIGVIMSNGANSWSSMSDKNKKENIKIAKGNYFIESIKKMELGSWNYIGQDAEDYRHWGPMAQDFYHYFGHDGIGTIGTDTTIATADIDGVMMIAIQQLARENDSIKNKNEMLLSEMASLKQEMTAQNQVLEAKVENFNKAKEEMDERLSKMEAYMRRTEPVNYTKR